MNGGKLIIITAPSGAGKTTMVRHIIKKYPELHFSTSATTRKPRNSEVDGKDYYFISQEAFKEKIEKGEFVEWEEVYEGQFYGTLKSEVDHRLAKNQNVLFDIDIQGALEIKKRYPYNSLAIFIKPPNLDILIDRLNSRRTENIESLIKRIEKAKKEMLYFDQFDRILINDRLEIAFKDIENMIESFLNEEAPL